MIKISDIEYFSNDRTIRFLNMDCNEFMKGCKENEFDLNHSDPPYGINMGGGRIGNSKIDYKQFSGADESIPEKGIFENIFKTSKNQIIWGGNYMIEHLYPTSGFLIWDKVQPEDFTMAMCEIAWTSFESPAKIFKKRIVGADKDGRIHPTQKPIDLYCWVIDKYTKPADTILDCFGGSMSNAIACHMMRRKLTIIELDKDYFDAAINRFAIYESKIEDIENLGFAKTELKKNYPTLF